MANTAIRLGYISTTSGGGGAGFEEYANLAAFPPVGEEGTIYLASDTKKIYVWTGSAYEEMSSSEDKANRNLDNLIQTSIPDGVGLNSLATSNFDITTIDKEDSTATVRISSGDSTVAGDSGDIILSVGEVTSGNKGNIELNSKNITANVDYYGSFIVRNQQGASNVDISTTGFGTPDNPQINFNGVSSSGVAAIQSFSKLNNNGGTTHLSSTMIYANTDGNYNGGNLNLTAGSNAFEGITAANASVSSGSVNITTSNAFTKGSATDANSGNIVIQTGNKEGSGTRGYVSLSGSHINANLAQIKNVADGTDNNDAINLSQLNSAISPLEGISEVLKFHVFENNAGIYADGMPGIRDTSTLIRDGWYFQNAAGQKINWYFFDGNPLSSTYQGAITQANFNAYVVMTLDNKNSKPIMALYSLPTGSGDVIPGFAHSRWVYELSTAALSPLLAGTKYLFYIGTNPPVHPELQHVALDLVPIQSVGDKNPAELILTAALNSNSTEPAGEVSWMVESLGVFSPTRKQEMELRIRTVPLNSASKIDAIYLPSYVDDVLEYANLATFPVTGETGKIYVALDTNKIYRWSGSAYIEISPGAIPPVLSVNTKTGHVVLDKTDIGLGNVDNTSDLNKPISTATQTALNLKYDASNPAGYITAAEVPESPVLSVNQQTGNVFLDKYDIGLENVDNTSDLNKPISNATQAALDLITDVNWTGDYDNGRTYTVGEGVMYNGASFRMVNFIGAAGYAPPAYPGSWVQVTDYVSANDIGLGSVDNTSDLDKPISTATQTALDDKADTNLDNLVATAIPSGVNLESVSVNPSSTTGFSLRTKDQTTSVSGRVSVKSGTATGNFSSGSVDVLSGSNSDAQGTLNTTFITGFSSVRSGNITGGTKGTTGITNLSSGAITISSTTPFSGNTGNIGVGTGGINAVVSGVSITGNSGSLQITSGNISPTTGATIVGNTGSNSLITGNVTGTGTTTSNTGDAALRSGNITNTSNTGNTGSVNIASGNNSATGNSGDVNITTGTVTSGTRGKLNINATSIDVNNIKITELANGVDLQDAVNVSQLNAILDYTPADASDWTAPVPDDVKEALDQLADRLESGTGVNIDAFSDMKEPTGFFNRTDSSISLSYNSGTNTVTFSIQPTASSFQVYVKGTKYTKSALESVSIISPTAGIHYLYYNPSGVLSTTSTFSSSLFEDNALVSLFYWNTDTNTYSYFAEERHGLTMDGATHAYLHTVFGARYLSGLALQSFTIGDGSLNAHAQFTADSGSIRDEDLLLSIPAQLQIPVLFRQGQLWRKKTADAYPVIYSGSAGYTGASGRIPYNQFVGGNWQLTEVDQNKFVLVHLFATNDKETPIVAIQGINQYNDVPSARNAANTEITTLSGLPFAEFAAIGTVIFQTVDSYTNDVNARVVPINSANYVDFRGTQLYTPAGEATTHSLLSGLAGDDHFQYHNDARGDLRYNLKSAGDISETSYSITNSQTSAHNITGFAFDNAIVRSFEAEVSIKIDADLDLFEKVSISGIQKGSDWEIAVRSLGDSSGVVFSITSAGQLQYTSLNYTGFVSGTIKFRAITTSV